MNARDRSNRRSWSRWDRAIAATALLVGTTSIAVGLTLLHWSEAHAQVPIPGPPPTPSPTPSPPPLPTPAPTPTPPAPYPGIDAGR